MRILEELVFYLDIPEELVRKWKKYFTWCHSHYILANKNGEQFKIIVCEVYNQTQFRNNNIWFIISCLVLSWIYKRKKKLSCTQQT